jgi:hypothetical protein
METISTYVGIYEEYLQEYELNEVQVVGDGNCLFRCFAYFLNILNDYGVNDHSSIRKVIINYMKEHREGKFIDKMFM